MATNSNRFRKKPVVVEAVQFTGDNVRDVWELMYGSPPRSEFGGHYPAIRVGELGDYAKVGDWIIRYEKGALSVCGFNEFNATYEPLEPA